MEIQPIVCDNCEKIDILYLIPFKEKDEEILVCLCETCKTEYVNAFLDNLNFIKLLPVDND